jgi:hypothetical protein
MENPSRKLFYIKSTTHRKHMDWRNQCLKVKLKHDIPPKAKTYNGNLPEGVFTFFPQFRGISFVVFDVVSMRWTGECVYCKKLSLIMPFDNRFVLTPCSYHLTDQ